MSLLVKQAVYLCRNESAGIWSEKTSEQQSEMGQTGERMIPWPDQTRRFLPETIPHPRQHDIICLVRGAVGRLHTKAQCDLVMSERWGGALSGLLYLHGREHKTNLTLTIFKVPEPQLYRWQPGLSALSECSNFSQRKTLLVKHQYLHLNYSFSIRVQWFCT